jgi:hypothetical protein
MTLKLEQGDAFERRNADWIRATLPRYEETWTAFIGKKQSGPAKPMDMPGLTPELERSREEFYQAHYSLARKLLLLTKLSKEIVDSIGDVRTYEQFEETEDRLFRYGSYLGFIFDMFERIEITLKPLGGFCEELRSFYNQRHHIIHTPHIPHTIDANGIYMIPRIASEKGLDGQWHKSSVWSEFKDGDFVCLAEFVEETTSSFLDIVRKCHAKVFDAANRRFEGRRIVVDEFQVETNTTGESLSTFHQTVHARTDEPPKSFTTDISGQYVPPASPGFSNSNQ